MTKSSKTPPKPTVGYVRGGYVSAGAGPVIGSTGSPDHVLSAAAYKAMGGADHLAALVRDHERAKDDAQAPLPKVSETFPTLTQGDIERISDAVLRKILPFLQPVMPHPYTPPPSPPWPSGPVWPPSPIVWS